MSYRMPAFTHHRSTQTTVTFTPVTSDHEAIRDLSSRTYKELQGSHLQEDFVDTKTIILEILNFLLSRAFWISDPDEVAAETNCQETQTVIRYNHNANIIVLDKDAQTKLTCEPRHSNSKLLVEYKETKNFIQFCLEECLSGLDSRIIVDELIDEIIAKGAEILKYPMKEQVIQTVASYKSRDIKEKEVLQKLRARVVIDPLEASTVVVPLIDDLLLLTCAQVSRDARRIVKNILESWICRKILIDSILAKPRKQLQLDSVEQILDRRRKMIVESMLKKETKTAVTQTELAGVAQVTKIKEPKEVLCSICVEQSLCQWCVEAEEKKLVETSEIVKLRRTQDILLAYKPCYVVATASEEMRSPHLQPAGKMKKIETPSTAKLYAARCATPEKTNINDSTIDDITLSKENIQVKNSVCGWTHVINDALAKSWSPKGSASNEIVTTATSSVAKVCDKKLSQYVPNLQTAKALQVLKNTFCTRDTCSAILTTLEERNSIVTDANNKKFCDLTNCTLVKCSKQLTYTDVQICARPRVDKFKASTQSLSENYLKVPI
ncbi:uncharacterized protein LOC109864239 isoform X2 [Pseudomyrmex gracilis]|nr:uncharacterized protein LOC109864239 isoform X2 [Pseudomyrmex gracilis]